MRLPALCLGFLFSVSAANADQRLTCEKINGNSHLTMNLSLHPGFGAGTYFGSFKYIKDWTGSFPTETIYHGGASGSMSITNGSIDADLAFTGNDLTRLTIHQSEGELTITNDPTPNDGFHCRILANARALAVTLADIGIHVSIQPGVYQAQAGQSAMIPVAIHVDHPELATSGDVSLYFWGFLSDHEGAKNPDLTIPIVQNGKVPSLPDKLLIPTTVAMSGLYPLHGQVSDLVEWADVLTDDNQVSLQIDNTPAQTDVDGPVFKNVKIPKQFHRGEKIMIQVTAEDKSPICLDNKTAPGCAGLDSDNSLAVICKVVQGVCLDDDGDGYVSSGGKIVKAGNQRYDIVLDASAPQRTGKFGLEVWSLMDVWGNQSHGLSKPIFFDVVP